ncbi:GntR family transcriptional regulator [Citricoccus sp. GCM10030269]|uniref:GntR family transcriptional regulator n=1 Tax=Citricoccus sp. GCM10030269 TaxID=3273388 RepID=UPI0036147978
MISALDTVVRKRQHQARWTRDLLRADVMRGCYDTVLPSESDLMEAYSVSRSVIRSALQALCRQNVLDRIPGTGTLVVAQRRAFRLTQIHGFGDGDQLPTYTSTDIVDVRWIRMSSFVASKLEETPGTECLRYEFVGFKHGQPIAIYTNYVRQPHASAILATPFSTNWYQLLRDAGIDYSGSDIVIDAVPADHGTAELLDVEPGFAVLGMERVIFDRAGKPFTFGLLRTRSDQQAFYAHVKREHSPQPT